MLAPLFAACAVLLVAQDLSDQQQETFLLRARIIGVRPASIGITRSRRATLSNARITHDAHLQTIDDVKGELHGPSRTETNFHDSYKGNIAAYRLDRLLELRMVPVSVERLIDGVRAAVTWWVDDVAMDEASRRKKKIEPPDRQVWSDQYHIVRVFDALIDNTDRNLGNLLIDRQWNLWMIDHTRAFGSGRALRNVETLVRCDRRLLDRLKTLRAGDLEAALRPYLTRDEVAAMLARRDLLVRHFDELAAARGPDTVIYLRRGMR